MPPPQGDYTRFLQRDALRGARIGIPRAFYYEPVVASGGTARTGGLSDTRRAVMDDAVRALREAGAVVVDPADVPSVITPDVTRNVLAWPICSGRAGARGRDENCSTVFKYGMKRDFNAWLASLGPAAPVRTLTELRDWNRARERGGTLKYGQTQLDISDEIDLEADAARYRRDRAKDLQLAGREGIDAVLRAHDLDALLFPAFLGASLAARPGYPSVIVPFGTVPNDTFASLPRDFNPRPAPFGVTFTAGACSEGRLIELAYAFEQRTRRRVPPLLP